MGFGDKLTVFFATFYWRPTFTKRGQSGSAVPERVNPEGEMTRLSGTNY